MKLGLIGNPNVGKSLIFNQLTGLGVEVSNYPGTTIGLAHGSVCYDQERLDVIDLPGVYSLDGTGEEERLVRDCLSSGSIDVAIVVIDAVHLERNLYLLLQVTEYSLPVILVLNMIDEADAQGLSIDSALLSGILGIEVISTAAITGRNVANIIPVALASARPARLEIHYDHHIEAAERSLTSVFQTTRFGALLALQGIGDDPEMLESAKALATEIERRHHMSIHQIVAGNRHHLAAHITERVVHSTQPRERHGFDRVLTTSFPGIPILIAVLVGIFAIVFTVGSWLEGYIVGFFNLVFLQPLLQLGLPPLAEQILVSVILAFSAGLGIAFPFVFTFYIFIAILEDSGYLTRAAFLADRVMHKLGMHGQAVIPLVLGFGCNVPAVMSIRLLRTRRERFIASFLVTMVPCSARTVVIAGVLAAFVGLWAAFSIYLIIFVLVVLTGFLLSRIAPGEQFGMIMEMAPLRIPRPGAIVRKAWRRIREFLVIAMPLLVVTSVALGLMEWAGIIAVFQDAIAPLSQAVLGLPSYASTALLFGILRKEMALGTLVVLAGTPDLGSVMSSVQLYTFALVSTLFVPCISTLAILYHEMGGRVVIAVTFYTFLVGVIIGALIHLTFG